MLSLVYYCFQSPSGRWVSNTPTCWNMYWFSILSVSVLATASLGLATPLSSLGHMRVKHSWGSVPEKWEFQGHCHVGTTIDLSIALKPHRENALIDALYEVSDPTHSSVFTSHFFRVLHMHIRCATDMAFTCPRSKSQSLSLLIRTHSTSSLPGLLITVFNLLRSLSRMAEVG